MFNLQSDVILPQCWQDSNYTILHGATDPEYDTLEKRLLWENAWFIDTPFRAFLRLSGCKPLPEDSAKAKRPRHGFGVEPSIAITPSLPSRGLPLSDDRRTPGGPRTK